MTTHNYQDLTVWQKAMDLVQEVYGLSSRLPQTEVYALANQMRRAAVSIPSNIAEGQKRLNRAETIHFTGIALGSIAELETQLILSARLYKTDPSIALGLCSEVGKMSTMLVKRLRSTV